MKICFVLPGNGNIAVGGYKIVYQYANKLVQLGHDVTISYIFSPRFDHNAFFRYLKYFASFINLSKRNKEQVTWFRLDPRVRSIYNLVTASQLKRFEVVVATSVETSYFVAKLQSDISKKFYFIQNYETWVHGQQYVDKSYGLGLRNIVIATWLQEIVIEKCGIKPPIIPNFLETNFYFPNTSEIPRGSTVALLNHSEPTKRTKYGLQILQEVKKKVPDLEVNLFGVWKMPEDLPSWVHIFYKPDQKVLRDQVYGRSKVYFMPTVLEGWGLTGMEAMISGDVVVASNTGGIREYIHNNEDGILVDPYDEEANVNAIVHVLRDQTEQRRLAKNGIAEILKFNINRSTDALLSVFNGKYNESRN